MAHARLFKRCFCWLFKPKLFEPEFIEQNNRLFESETISKQKEFVQNAQLC